MDWKHWIGLPHEFGADPEDGKACDCLVMPVSHIRRWMRSGCSLLSRSAGQNWSSYGVMAP